MPQRRIHPTNADRQRAYRARVRARLHRAAEVAANPHQVQAPFRITGRDGRPLLEVVEARNGPILRMLGADGRPLVILEAHAEGGGIYCLAPSGEAGAQLFAEQKSGRLSLMDSHGREVLELPQ